ncbi:hypothetical protein D3C86_1529330 [compost metagenome]
MNGRQRKLFVRHISLVSIPNFRFAQVRLGEFGDLNAWGLIDLQVGNQSIEQIIFSFGSDVEPLDKLFGVVVKFLCTRSAVLRKFQSQKTIVEVVRSRELVGRGHGFIVNEGFPVLTQRRVCRGLLIQFDKASNFIEACLWREDQVSEELE